MTKCLKHGWKLLFYKDLNELFKQHLFKSEECTLSYAIYAFELCSVLLMFILFSESTVCN